MFKSNSVGKEWLGIMQEWFTRVEKDDVESAVKFWPNQSQLPHSEFEAEVYVLSKKGWETHSIFQGYEPQFYIQNH